MSESEWRDGDVFFWRYRDDLGDQTQKYWCCARMAIVDGLMLRDIYWVYVEDGKANFHSANGRNWRRQEAEEILHLEYKGNLDEFDAIADYNEHLYDRAHILDLRHANSMSRQVYLRKGARRSRAAMLDRVNYKIEKTEGEIKSAQWTLERLTAEKAKIEAGDLEGIWL